MRLICLILILSIAGVDNARAQVVVQVQNPVDLERPDEVISLAWEDLLQRLPGLNESAVRTLDAGTRAEIPSQVIDEDADGTPDALIFLADFWPNQLRAFVVEPQAPSTPAEPRVHVAHVPARDDVAWESDRIAFRTYGQGLWELEDLISSGVDVWTKRGGDLVIDRWYAMDGSYHVDTGEGADFYSVGTSLGTGGNAVWLDGDMHRPQNFSGHRIIENGPVRAIFELEYEPWTAGELEVSQVKRITIDAGQNLYREELTFRSESGEAIPYVVGVVKRAGGVVGSMRQVGDYAWLSVWGDVDTGAGGHGDLGSAVLMDAAAARDFVETDDHYLVVGQAESGQPVSHYVGAGWTAGGDFDGVEDWWDHLDALAARLEAPLEVVIVD